MTWFLPPVSEITPTGGDLSRIRRPLHVTYKTHAVLNPPGRGWRQWSCYNWIQLSKCVSMTPLDNPWRIIQVYLFFVVAIDQLRKCHLPSLWEDFVPAARHTCGHLVLRPPKSDPTQLVETQIVWTRIAMLFMVDEQDSIYHLILAEDWSTVQQYVNTRQLSVQLHIAPPLIHLEIKINLQVNDLSWITG